MNGPLSDTIKNDNSMESDSKPALTIPSTPPKSTLSNTPSNKNTLISTPSAESHSLSPSIELHGIQSTEDRDSLKLDSIAMRLVIDCGDDEEKKKELHQALQSPSSMKVKNLINKYESTPNSKRRHSAAAALTSPSTKSSFTGTPSPIRLPTEISFSTDEHAPALVNTTVSSNSQYSLKSSDSKSTSSGSTLSAKTQLTENVADAIVQQNKLLEKMITHMEHAESRTSSRLKLLETKVTTKNLTNIQEDDSCISYDSENSDQDVESINKIDTVAESENLSIIVSEDELSTNTEACNDKLKERPQSDMNGAAKNEGTNTLLEASPPNDKLEKSPKSVTKNYDLSIIITKNGILRNKLPFLLILAFVIIYIFFQQKGLCIFNWKEVNDYESASFADDTKYDSYTVSYNTIDNDNKDRFDSGNKADSKIRINTEQNDVGRMEKDEKSLIENELLDKDTTPFKEVDILQDVASAHNVTNRESIINDNSHLVNEGDDSQMRKSTEQNDTGSMEKDGNKADSQIRINTEQNDIGRMEKDEKSLIENESLDKDTTPFKEVDILQDVASAHNVSNLESIINNNSHLVNEGDDSQMRKSTKENDTGSMEKDDKSPKGNESLGKDTTTLIDVDIFQDVAAQNDVTKLESMIKQNPHLVHKRDADGWQAIHIAALQGHINCVKLLVERGKADVNSRGGPFLTDKNKKKMLSGGSLLWVALSYGQLENDHPVISYLNSVGAKMVLPLHL